MKGNQSHLHGTSHVLLRGEHQLVVEHPLRNFVFESGLGVDRDSLAMFRLVVSAFVELCGVIEKSRRYRLQTHNAHSVVSLWGVRTSYIKKRCSLPNFLSRPFACAQRVKESKASPCKCFEAHRGLAASSFTPRCSARSD